MKLTDNEIRDITEHLEADKPLPDKYRFLLFEEKREVAAKVVDIFGNDTMTIVEVRV